MTHRTFIAVDPGGSGAIAWSNRQGVFVEAMPSTRGDTISLIQKAVAEGVDPVAYIEKVAPFIPDGGASMMFEYGRRVERVGCICEMSGIRIIEIIPRSWQKELGLGNSERVSPPRMPKGLTVAQKNHWRLENKVALSAAKVHNAKAKRDWKNKLKEEAQRRFPQQNVTLKTCDALLLLDAAIKLEGEKLNL